MLFPGIWRAMLVGGLLFAAGCGDEKARRPHRFSVENCKAALADKDYTKAIREAEGVLAKDPADDEAHYCAALANFGALVQSWSAIFGLVASQLAPPPSFAPESLDVKVVVGSILADIEAFLGGTEKHLFALAAAPDPTISLDDFPVGIDPKDILDLLGTDDIIVHGDLSVNLHGTWDKSHVLLLGAFINLAQTMRDYLFAHRLLVASSDMPDGSAASYAYFFANNPDLFVFDNADLGRLRGRDGHVGVKNQALAMVSYLAGRKLTIANVVPANAGLTREIARSATMNAEAPLRWIDENHDGVPEKLMIPSLPSIDIVIDDKTFDEATIDNPLGVGLWESVLNLAADVRDNLEAAEPQPIDLQPVLTQLWATLAGDPANANVRLLRREAPHIFALNPSAFFSQPIPIRDLMPYTFSFEATTAEMPYRQTGYDLAIESEHYVNPAENYLDKMYMNAATGADFHHFVYTGLPQTVGEYRVTAYEFYHDGLVPVSLAPDGITATAKSPVLYNIAFPYPGLGGMVVPDPDGFTGVPTFPRPTNAGLNKSLNLFIQYYCLDLTRGTVESIDETLYDASNRIEDCP